MKILKIYKRILHSRPILTQAVQTGVLMGTGDMISQVFIEKKQLRDYSILRTMQFTSVGFCFLGPALSAWYRLLAKHVGTKGRIVTLKKVALDQLCFAPVCLGSLLFVLNTIQGLPPRRNVRKIKRCYKDIMIANYKLWPAVQIINFYLVPLNYQVLLVQCVAISWNIYFSWKTQSERSVSTKDITYKVTEVK